MSGRSELEAEAGRLAFELDRWTPPRRLRREGACEYVAFLGEREELGASLGTLAELFGLRVGAVERLLVEGDLGFERPAAAAVPPV
jgi:hypothetical protein